MKQWYEIVFVQEKTVKVYAADLEEAEEKAEAKLNKRNSKWMVSHGV